MATRIDLRPDEEAKARLDRASAKLGLPLSSFVLSAALDRAQEILAREERILSDRDRDRVMALLGPKRPRIKPALRRALARHEKLIARSEE